MDDDAQRWGPDAVDPLGSPSASPAPPSDAPPMRVPLLPPSPAVVSRRGRGRLVLGGVLVLALVVGVAALVTRSADGTDPDAALAAAQAVVDQSESYRYELRQVSHLSTGDPDGAGTDTTSRRLTKGTVAAPDRWQMVEDGDEMMGGDSEMKMIRVGDTIYSEGFSLDDAVGPSWVSIPFDQSAMGIDGAMAMYGDSTTAGGDVMTPDPYEDEYRLDGVMMAYLYGLGGQPSSVGGLIARAADPVVSEQLGAGGVRLRTTLTPAREVVEAMGEDVPPVDLLLDLDADDRPVLAKFSARSGSASADVEITFSDWGEAIVVEAPADGDIDATPWISEEALADLPAGQLVAPSDLPRDLALVQASVVSGEDYGMEDGCASVELYYSSEAMTEAMTEAPPPEDVDEAEFDDLGFLSISVTSKTCQSAFGEDGFAGMPGIGGMANVTVGDAVVLVSSSLDEDELAALTASLRPVTVDELVASVPPWAGESMVGGGFGLGLGLMPGL